MFRGLLRLRVRNVILALFGMYLCVVLLFYVGMQKSTPESKRNIPDTVERSDVIPGAPAMGVKKPIRGHANEEPLYIKQRSSMFTPKYKAMKEPVHIDQVERKEPKSTSHQPRRNPRGNCIGSDPGREFDFIEVISEKLFVYSAYWDTRPNDFDNKHNGTFVRIMSVLKSGGKKTDVACKFHTADDDVRLSSATYYEMCENHGRQMGGFILSCPLPTEIIGQPCSVEVSATKSQEPVSSLKVRPISPKENREEFAVCVPPLHGNINPRKLVEFVEMTRLLGAQRIVFYDYQVSEDIAKILEYYQDKEYVEVIPWMYPHLLERDSWYHGQLIAIQDCLYRNMHSAEYLTFNDIDEYIVPHEHADWSQLVEQSFQPGQCAFQFQSAFFPPIESDQHETTVLTAKRRTTFFSPVRTKCMVKPYSIFEAGIHHISKPIWANLKVTKMSENTAFLHHYRICMMEYGMNCKNFMEDKSMLKYTNDISGNIERTLKHLESKDS